MAIAAHEKYLPPMARRALQIKHPPKAPKERRESKRIKIAELNTLTEDQLRTRLDEVKKKEDRRPWYVKVLDVIDIPRNIVGNVIGDIAGVDKTKLRKGTLMKKVYMSDVLGKMGVKNKYVKAIAGFAGDVAVDPLMYLSAGAVTGLAIGRHAPRLLRGGQVAMRQAGKAMAAGRAVSPAVAKALGTSSARLAQWGSRAVKAGVKRGLSPEKAAKVVGKRLMARRGGKLTQLLARRLAPGAPTKAAEKGLKGAAEFMLKYGEKGRTILRVPFAGKGLALRTGRRAELYKGLADPDILKRALETGGFRAAGRVVPLRAAQKAATARITKRAVEMREEIAALKPTQPAAAKRMTQHLKTLRTTGKEVKAGAELKWQAGIPSRQAARAKYLSRISDPFEAPMIRGVGEAKWGTAVPPAAGVPPQTPLLTRMKWGAQRAKRAVLGQEPTPVSQRMRAGWQEATVGAPVKGGRTGEAIGKELTPIVARLSQSTNIPPAQVQQRIISMLEVTPETIAALRQGDPGLGMFLQTAQQQAVKMGMKPLAPHRAAAIGADPAVQKFVTDMQDAIEAVRAGAQAAGVPGMQRVPGFFPRIATKETRAATLAQETRMGRTPWTAPRRQVQPMAIPGQAPRDIVVGPKPSRDIQALIQRGDLPAEAMAAGKPVTPTTQQWNVWSQALKGGPAKPLFGPYAKPQQFVTDVPEAVGRMTSQAIQQTEFVKMGRYLKGFGVSVPKGMAATDPQFANMAQIVIGPDNPLGRLWGPHVQGKMFPAPVAQIANDYLKTFSTKAGVNKFLQATDKMYSYWKALALIHPAYWLRNRGQALIGTMMAGGLRTTGRWTKRMTDKRSNAVVDAVLDGKSIDKMTMPFRGVETPARGLVATAKMGNLFNASMTSNLMHPGLNPGRWFNKGIRRFFEWNNKWETRERFNLFITLMEEGLTPGQATMKVLRAMPDLSDLTVLEKNVFRRLFPWFSWMRRNSANQVHFLINQPGWIAGSEKLRRGIQQMAVGDKGVPDELRADWMQEAQATQFKGNDQDGYVWLLASWLPFQDLVRIGSGGLSLQAGAKAAMEQMRPELKFIAELATKHDIFRGREIKDVGPMEGLLKIPSALFGASGTPLDNIIGVRPLREARRIQEMPTGTGMLSRAVLGGAIQPVSRQRGLAAESTRLRELLMDIRRRLNRAKESGDQPEYNELLRQWVQAMSRAQQLGLGDLVPKSTAQVMQRGGVPAGEPAFPER